MTSCLRRYVLELHLWLFLSTLARYSLVFTLQEQEKYFRFVTVPNIPLT